MATFGKWPSPLAVSAAAAGRRSRAALSSQGDHLYWLESRPEEGGRTLLVRAGPEAAPRRFRPRVTSLRSRVDEYGGGAYCLVPVGGVEPAVAYVDQTDQRVWLLMPGGGGWLAPVALTVEPSAGERWHHGDLWATADGRWVLAVRERHLDGGVTRQVVALAVSSAGPSPALVLSAGRDFFAAPRPDPSGRRLAWICWDHPDMPWDASELWVGELSAEDPEPTPAGGNGGPSLVVQAALWVAGGRRTGPSGDGVSIGQPLWCRDGSLAFASDVGGWWQPWRRGPDGDAVRLCAEEAEFHGPDWVLGQASMAELPGGVLACRRRRQGADAVGLLRPGSDRFEVLAQPCVSVVGLCAHQGGVAWLGATPTNPVAPWWGPVPVEPGGPVTPAVAVGAGDRPLLASSDVSVADHFSLEAAGGYPVHGLFYAPVLDGVRGPDGTRPPLVVVCHGGPTGNAEAGFDPIVQLLTSHGFAVAAVDYAGSTGYGRAYRQRLWGTWGVADPDDCVAAARHLAAAGRVDPSRMAIRGGSAGGLTALNALVRSDVFAAAVSWYGVTDLLALAAATHDFESRYLDRLVGPLPEAADEYRRRSPVHRVDDMAGARAGLPGPGRPGRAPGPGHLHGGGAAASGVALRVPGLSRRVARVPSGRDAGSLPGGRARLLPRGPVRRVRRGPSAGAVEGRLVVQGHGRGSPYCRAGLRESHGA